MLLLAIKTKRGQIYKRFECGSWKNYLSILQLPVWITAVEAIRKLCGVHVGLLGMMFGREFDTPELNETARVAGMELSLGSEGMLWFPDLLVPDPMLVLPFMLSGVVYMSLANSTAKNPTKGQRRLMNALKIVALAMGPLTLQMPSAMLVYWISSSGFALAQARILDRLMPLPKPFEVPKQSEKVKGSEVEEALDDITKV